jgi:N6-adenosine-specific RNA methylase IME4
MKKYQIIYADPPWSYNDKMKGTGLEIEKHYPTLKLDGIKKFKVNDIAEKDSVLFMWVVSPMLDDGIELMKSWGFKFKTVAFCWAKKSKNDKWLSNLGRWTMGGVELCLLGVKGKPNSLRKAMNVKQLVIAERKRHSEKPEEVRKRITDLMGDLPRIELFARQKTEGWDVWGNEVESDITL